MSALPVVERIAPPRVPSVSTATLPNGLRVVAVRRPGVPMVHIRLRIPAPFTSAAGAARSRLQASSLLLGTATRTDLDISDAIRSVGGSLGASADADGLRMAGAALASGYGDLLDLLADVLTGASFPTDLVGRERTRLAEELVLVKSQPSVLADEALDHHMYGRHAYGLPLPAPGTMARVSAGSLRSLRTATMLPRGSTLVVVGNLPPARLIGEAAARLRGWRAAGRGGVLPPPGSHPAGPILIVHRPRSVQTSIRMAGPAVPRTDPAYPALELTSMVLGGYFSSRLVRNLREDKGFTYHVRSSIEQSRAASRFLITTDVAAEVTAPALLELRYELGRMTTGPAGADEMESARRYRLGSLAIGTHTQAGLADYLDSITVQGLSPAYLRELPAALARLGPDDLIAAARRFMAPAGLLTVLLGDADLIEPSVSSLGPVRVLR